jgi:hypothetical protein
MFNVLVKGQLTLTVSMKNVNTDVCILNFCLLTSLRSVDTKAIWISSFHWVSIAVHRQTMA